MLNEPLLTQGDLMNPAVIKIIKYFDDRLTKLRIENDSFTAHEATKGRIAEIKSFNLAVKPKVSTSTNNDRSSAL